MRLHSALPLEVRDGHGGPQLLQGRAAEDGCEKHAVGLERNLAALEERGEIVHPMEREVADDEVERTRSEGESTFIIDNGVLMSASRRDLIRVSGPILASASEGGGTRVGDVQSRDDAATED